MFRPIALALIASTVFGSFAKADDLLERKALSRLTLEGPYGVIECDKRAQALAAQLKAKLDAVSLPGSPGVSADGQGCTVHFVIASKTSIDQKLFLPYIIHTGFSLVAAVDTRAGTYAGLTARAYLPNGKSAECRTPGLKRVRDWVDAYTRYSTVVNKVRTQPLAERAKWIASNLDCGPLGKLKSVEVEMAVGNRQACGPVDYQTCLILKGLEKISIPLQDSAVFIRQAIK